MCLQWTGLTPALMNHLTAGLCFICLLPTQADHPHIDGKCGCRIGAVVPQAPVTNKCTQQHTTDSGAGLLRSQLSAWIFHRQMHYQGPVKGVL